MNYRLWLSAVVASGLLLTSGCALNPFHSKASSRHTSSSNTVADQAKTGQYAIDINYPTLDKDYQRLDDALHAQGEKAKHAFLKDLPQERAFPDEPYELLIDFSKASETERFISIRQRGMQDTHGAHPIPIDNTFVYDKQDDKVVNLSDLFVDTEAKLKQLLPGIRGSLMQQISSQMHTDDFADGAARRSWEGAMRGMITEGTEPTLQNFSHFIIIPGKDGKALGISFIFPPYQVAPYVYGSMSVDVPASRLQEGLVADYRGVFSDD